MFGRYAAARRAACGCGSALQRRRRTKALRIYASGTPVMAGCGPVAIGDHPRYGPACSSTAGCSRISRSAPCMSTIDVPDREVAVLVGNHLRPWLPLLVALSANSPFHHGRDTGYCRLARRHQEPVSVPWARPPYAESLRHHERTGYRYG